MTHAADVDMELPNWPIAPDGYIPNSVIRNWKRKGKQQSKADFWDDFFNANHLDEDATSDATNDATSDATNDATSDETARNILSVAFEDGEEEITFEAKRKRSEKGDETNKNEDNKQNAKEGIKGKGRDKMKVKERIGAFKPRMHQRKEEGECVFQKLPDIQVESSLSKNLKISTEKSLVPQKREISLNLKNTDSFISSRPGSVEIISHTQQRELQDKTELCEDITPPLQFLSTPKQPSTIPREWLTSPLGCAEAAISKQASDPQTVNQQTQLHTTAPPLSKSPPSSPEGHQPPPDVCIPEWSPAQHPSILLSAAKYDNIKNQSQLALNLQVLALYKRFKVHPPTFSPQSKRPGFIPTHGLSSPFAYISAGLHGQTRNLRAAAPFIVPLATIHRQQHSNIQPERPSPSCPADNQLTPQFRYPIRDSANRPMPEWRKTLHQLVSLQGFHSSLAAGRFAAGHPQEPPRPSQPPVTIPVLQRGQAEPSQRVMQKIALKDSTEPTHRCFTQVFPLAAHQTFVTSHRCGKTRYGKLQFDWARGF
ncbi:hypothetical protein AMECASPLE_026359 [Ameca splendens]|uniref:Uncharacterized protein n=1 Tax=Ameca splendens TaxID=208324 RepID=A0ABV1ACB1_9TELE